MSFTLKIMDKEQIKHKLLEAITKDPHIAAIKSVAIFGSYVNGKATEQSDVDVLIDFVPDAAIGFFALSDIKNHLQSFLQRPVDLLTPQAISKYFRQEVLSEAEYVYER